MPRAALLSIHAARRGHRAGHLGGSVPRAGVGTALQRVRRRRRRSRAVHRRTNARRSCPARRIRRPRRSHRRVSRGSADGLPRGGARAGPPSRVAALRRAHRTCADSLGWRAPANDLDGASAGGRSGRRPSRARRAGTSMCSAPATADSFAEWAGIKPPRAGPRSMRSRDRSRPSTRRPARGGSCPRTRRRSACRSMDSRHPRGCCRAATPTSSSKKLTVSSSCATRPDAPRLWTPRVWPGAVVVAGEVVGTWRRAGCGRHGPVLAPPVAQRARRGRARSAVIPLAGPRGRHQRSLDHDG